MVRTPRFNFSIQEKKGNRKKKKIPRIKNPIPGVFSSSNKLFIVLQFSFCFLLQTIRQPNNFLFAFPIKTYLSPCPTKRHTGKQQAKRKRISIETKRKESSVLFFLSSKRDPPTQIFVKNPSKSSCQNFCIEPLLLVHMLCSGFATTALRLCRNCDSRHSLIRRRSENQPKITNNS
jgi:hypothetical protein